MRTSEFFKIEYQSLRREIDSTKSRLFRIVTIGAVGVPGIVVAIDFSKFEALLLTAPFLVFVGGLMYISELQALMRCGDYIRDKYEKGSFIDGWETSLNNKENRRVDKNLYNAFFASSIFYYLATVTYALYRNFVFKYPKTDKEPNLEENICFYGIIPNREGTTWTFDWNTLSEYTNNCMKLTFEFADVKQASATTISILLIVYILFLLYHVDFMIVNKPKALKGCFSVNWSKMRGRYKNV